MEHLLGYLDSADPGIQAVSDSGPGQQAHATSQDDSQGSSVGLGPLALAHRSVASVAPIADSVIQISIFDPSHHGGYHSCAVFTVD